MHLYLETTGSSASTGLLELASLGLDVWLLVLVWAETEMLDSLTGVLWTSKKEGVASGWGTESELVEGENLTTSSKNAGTGGSGEAEGSNAELWNGQETVVISDGTDDDNGLVIGLLRHVGNDSGDGDRWAVDAGHKKATENDLVEGRIGTACQEAVKLDEQLHVDVVALWRLAVGASHMVSVKIDSYIKNPSSAMFRYALCILAFSAQKIRSQRHQI